jgi:hypothetical protein
LTQLLGLFTVRANSDFLVVGEFWQSQEILGALVAYGGSTLSAVVLPIDEEGKFPLANVAGFHLGIHPDRPLRLLER